MKFSGKQDDCWGGICSPWLNLNGPDAADREQAFRFGQRGELAWFEIWARQYGGGKFFDALLAEYEAGKQYEQEANQ